MPASPLRYDMCPKDLGAKSFLGVTGTVRCLPLFILSPFVAGSQCYSGCCPVQLKTTPPHLQPILKLGCPCHVVLANDLSVEVTGLLMRGWLYGEIQLFVFGPSSLLQECGVECSDLSSHCVSVRMKTHLGKAEWRAGGNWRNLGPGYCKATFPTLGVNSLWISCSIRYIKLLFCSSHTPPPPKKKEDGRGRER